MCSLCISRFKSSQSILLVLVFVGLNLPVFAQINPPSTIAKMPVDLDEVILNLGHNSTIVDLRVSVDGKYLWSVGNYGRDKIWDLQQARELRSITHYLSADGRYMPSSVAHKLRIHDNGEYVFDLDLSTGRLTRIEQKADRNYLFPSDNLESHMFTRSQLETLQFSLPNGTTLSRALNPSFVAYRYLFNAKRNLISVYGEFQAGRKVILSFHGTDYQDSIALNLNLNSKQYEFEDFWGWPGTDSLLGKNKNGEVFIFHPLKKDPIFRPFDSSRKINNLVFSPNQEVYALALKDNGAVEIRNVKDKSLVLKRYFATSRISKLVFTPSGENLLFSDGNIIWNWDLKADTVLQFGDFYEVNSNYNTHTETNILPSGKIVLKIPTFEPGYSYKIVDLHQGLVHYKEAVSGFGNLVKKGDRFLLDGTEGNYLDLLTEQTFLLPSWASPFWAVTPTYKGDRWAVIKNENELVMWDQNQGKVLFSKTGKSRFYQAVIDKRDSLIALNEKNQVLVLDAKTGQDKAIIPIKADSPYKLILKFSADSRYLFITNTDDIYITIWDMKSNSLFRKITMEYSDFFLFNATNDSQILFGLRARSLVAYNQQGKELYNLNLRVDGLTAEYFPADKLILVASRDGRIFQIDAQSGVLLKTLYLGKSHQWVSIDQKQQFETSKGAAHYVHYRTKAGGIGYFSDQKKSTEDAGSEPFPPLLKPLKISKLPPSTVKPGASSVASFNPMVLVNSILKTQLKDENAPSINASKIQVSKLPIYDPIIHAVYTKGDQYIIIQENSGQITILENATMRWLKTIKLEKPSSVKAVVSKDGHFLACLDGNQSIHLYNIHTGILVQKRTLEMASITSLAISANGQTLAAGSLEGLIYLFNTSDLNSFKIIRPSSGKILTMSFDGQKDQMACADFYANVFLYDLASLEKIPQPQLLGNYSNYGVIDQIEFYPDSCHLILRAREGILSIQYAKTDNPFKDFVITTRARWMHIDPSAPHRFYYHGESQRGYRWKVFDLTTSSNVDSIGSFNFIRALSGDGKQALTTLGYASPYIAVYNFESRKEKMITSTRVPIYNWDLANDTMYYQVSYQIHRVDLQSAKSEQISDKHVHGHFLNEGGKFSFVGDYLGSPPLTGKKIFGDTNYIWKLSGISGLNTVSKNGLYLACLWRNKDTAYVYSTRDLKVVHRLPLPKVETGNRIGISNNGQYLAIGNEGAKLRVYDLLSKKILFTSDYLTSYPNFSLDNSAVIFFDGKNGMAYDLKSAKLLQLATQSPQLKFVHSLSSNGRFAILFSRDNLSQLWDLKKGIPLGDFYFMDDERSLAAWAFIAVDGRFDGNSEGLKKMYLIDENTLKSKDLNLDLKAGYTPGLLGQLTK